MAPHEPPTDITLRVKVPSGYLESGDEFSVGSLPVTSNIGDVRRRIQQLLPSYPAPDQQRILYAGRALVDNDQPLADALNTKRDASQTEYVVHLLVKGEQDHAAPSAHRRAASTPAAPAPAASNGTNTPAPPAPPTPPHAQPLAPGLGGLTPQQQQQAMMAQQRHTMQVQQQMMLQAQRLNMPMPGFGMQGVPGAPAMPMMPGMLPNMQFGPNGQLAQPGQQVQAPQLQPQIRVTGPGFNQAVAQGQQQRAAQGLNGLANGTQQHHHAGDGQPQGEAQQNNNASQRDASAPNNNHAQQSGQQAQTQRSNGHTSVEPIRQPQQPPEGQTAQAQQGHQQAAPGALPQVPRRPVSGQGYHVEGTTPNGQRFAIHHHTMNFPGPPVFPGQQTAGMPPPMPGMPFPFAGAGAGMPGMLPMPFPGMAAQHHGQGQGGGQTNALQRARDNMTEMRRMLDEMREQNAEHRSPEESARLAGLEQRLQAVNDYIDPFRVSNIGTRTGEGRRSAPPQAGRAPQPLQRAENPILAAQRAMEQAYRRFNQPTTQHQTPTVWPGDVTAYLLSGPNGPQALLFSPQHGTYTGTFANNGLQGALSAGGVGPGASLQGQSLLYPTPDIARMIGGQQHAAPTPTPTPTTRPDTPLPPQQQAQAHAQGQGQPAPDQQQIQQQAHGQAAPAQQQQQLAAQQDPLAPIQPLLAHVWLLLRLLIFAYFLLGANLGWRRPVALALIGVGFLMIRAGLFGGGGVVRRWWEGVVRVDPAAQVEQAQQQGEGDGRRQMPTPEQLAQRLLEQRPRNAQLRRLREVVRPVERAVALFVASLWPGVGEAHVRAREAEARRLAEEEVGRLRREEEERLLREEEGTKAMEGGRQGGAAGEVVVEVEEKDGSGEHGGGEASASGSGSEWRGGEGQTKVRGRSGVQSGSAS